MKKRPHYITYITIEEKRAFHLNFDGTTRLIMVRSACVQRANADFSNNECRTYRGISEASILRLAKIQEKLAK